MGQMPNSSPVGNSRYFWDIPAIFDPQFVSIAEAESLYYDNEPLIVVADGDKAKAYSIWYLDQHEIVNDYINGKAITVTW